MKKYHVHTILSARHRELLDKFKEKYVTHQRVIEQALDCLEKNSKGAPTLPLFGQEMLRLKLAYDSGMLCLTQKETLKILIETADINRFIAHTADQKPAESIIEYYYQKPLKECSLKEIMDGLVVACKYAKWFDEISFMDDGGYYIMEIYHSMGINNSKIFQIFFESLFKTYGARADIKISDRSLFIKVSKKF